MAQQQRTRLAKDVVSAATWSLSFSSTDVDPAPATASGVMLLVAAKP